MSLPKDHICEAQEFGTVAACGRCALTWEIAANTRPSCKPKADPPIGLTEMAEAMREEASRILASQWCLMRTAARPSPYMPELRKASVMFASARLLDQVAVNAAVVKMLRGGA
jgi:hypothetical protein